MKAIVLGDFCFCNGKTLKFVISEPDDFHHQSRAAIQQLTAPVEMSKLVLTTHYDIIVTSRLAKNI